MWKFRSHDPEFGRGSPQDFIGAGDRVLGKNGDIRNLRGRATRDEWDWMGTSTVEIRWDDGRTTKVPTDFVVKIA